MSRAPRPDFDRRGRVALAAIYFGLALLVVQQHARYVNFAPRIHRWRVERHVQILRGEGRSPWTYRVVVPALTEATRPLVAHVASSPAGAFEASYLFWRLVFTTALLLLFHAYLRIWLEPPWAAAGTLFLAALQIPSVEGAWYQLDSTVDLTLWLAAALLTHRGHPRWLYPLIALGALNREGSVFIVAVHAALTLPREPFARVAARCAGLLACFTVLFAILRAAIGIQPWASPVMSIVRRNLEHPEWWVWVASFLGAFWVLGLLDLRRRPPELRLLALFLLPYLALQLVFGRLIEARLFLPLALALVPMGLLYLRDRLDKES